MKNSTQRALRGLVFIGAIAGSVTLLVAWLHVPTFHVVEQGKLYRSGQPDDEFDWERLEQKLDIQTVINLRPWDEDGGEWTAEEIDETDEHGVTLVNLPMRDTAVPSQTQADAFMQIVRDPARWPVLVHCKRGKDRTGTMCALYRIHVQGWSVERAVAELRDIDGDDPLNEGVDEFLRTYRPPATQPAGR